MSNSLFFKSAILATRECDIEREDLVKIQNAFITLDLDEEFLEMAEEGDISTLPLEDFSFFCCKKRPMPTRRLLVDVYVLI